MGDKEQGLGRRGIRGIYRDTMRRFPKTMALLSEAETPIPCDPTTPKQEGPNV